ncbi:hypothetical protein V1506DRAFT_543998 [Lipomyces tetrasporus]
MATLPKDEYDFIIVGAGAAGCALAWRLAGSKKRPSVLLAEAGGKNDLVETRIDGNKWINRLHKKQNWRYQTVPQKHLNGRVIPYDRGKGLGGSTSINFAAFTCGPSDDYDEIARLVGDDEWKWVNMQKRFISLESYHGFAPDISKEQAKYVNANAGDHGASGPLKIGFPSVWEKSLTTIMDIFNEAGGVPLNPDANSGNPIGLSVAPNAAYKGVISNAADLLKNAPENLHILTHAQVGSVIFENKTAKGILTLDHQKYFTAKEVIVSAGSLDTPKILMHSGVGPADQLSKFDITVIEDSPYIGKHLQDHLFVFLSWERVAHLDERKKYYSDKSLQAAARAQWYADHTGPLSEIGCVYAQAYLKSEEIFESEEFKNLPEYRQAHLLKPTIPAFEVELNPANAEYFIDPENTPAMEAIVVFPMNSESRGSVTLQSSDPKEPLLYDPNFFASSFDKRAAIVATRATLKIMQTPDFMKDTVKVTSGPKSDSDEDILDYWEKEAGSSWHMSGTCKMGISKEEDEACIDSSFRVFGLKGLRVADMSVLPILTNNHTQATAYAIGITAADKIIAEYNFQV